MPDSTAVHPYLRAAKKHPTLRAHANERLEERKGQGKPEKPGKPDKTDKPNRPA